MAGLGDTSNNSKATRPVALLSSSAVLPTNLSAHWTPLDVDAGDIVRGTKLLRGHLWGATFYVVSDHRMFESLDKIIDHARASMAWIPQRLQVAPAISQGQCQRKHRVLLAPATSSD